MTRPVIFIFYVIAAIGLILMTVSGFALTRLYKISGWPSGLKAWNCWAFAFAKWLEAGARKTYLIVRVSKHGPIPHVMYAKSISGLIVAELKPLNPKSGWRAVFDSVKFENRVREGEGEEKRK